MWKRQPYLLLLDRDAVSRARVGGALRYSGFAAVAFAESRGALAALAARPADLVLIGAALPGGEDALAAARQVRHCRAHTRVLFIGAPATLPAAAGPDIEPDCGRVVTLPFDRRRLLAGVFALLGEEEGDLTHLDDAEFALIEAQLACLRHRRTLAGGEVAFDVEHQIRDALQARDALRPALAAPAID